MKPADSQHIAEGGQISDSRRILHMVHVMDRGGLETWLMHVLRNIDRDRFRMDFLVRAPEAGSYDPEIRTLGSRVFTVDHTKGLRSYALGVRHVLETLGPFDVAHSHLGFFTGINLLLASRARVPIRIAHCHNTGSSRYESRPMLQALYRTALRPLVRRYATRGFGCSEAATAFLFGRGWRNDPRWEVLWLGFDFTPFTTPTNLPGLRAAFGIPSDRVVIGHVGRFNEQKNHAFLLEVFSELIGSGLNGHLLLVGKGHLMDSVRAQVRRRGLAGRVSMTGETDDVSAAYSVMDVKLLPSHYEGLGIVVVEAQAAGVPVLISDVVPPEVDQVSELIHRLPITAGAAAWAGRVREILAKPLPTREDSLRIVRNGPFAIAKTVDRLSVAYLSR